MGEVEREDRIEMARREGSNHEQTIATFGNAVG